MRAGPCAGKLWPGPRGSRSMEPPRTASLPRAELQLLLALALARLLLHLLTNGQYGFHRDELAVLDDSRHLAWGYVAYPPVVPFLARSEEHTSELQSLMRSSYAVFCLKKKKKTVYRHMLDKTTHKTTTQSCHYRK